MDACKWFYKMHGKRGCLLHQSKKKTIMENEKLLNEENNDGVDRAGFLKCMAWGRYRCFIWMMSGGIMKLMA